MIHTTSNNYKLEKYITQTRRDPAIVSLRTIAMMLIVITHVAMVYDMTVLRYVTRVGTPLFFLMSGFLYGQKTIKNWSKFYLRRWKSLALPIYIWLIFVSLVLGLMFSIYYSKSQYLTYIFNLYGISHRFVTSQTPSELKSFFLIDDHIQGIAWLQQIWFMTYLMACLLALPFIQKLRELFSSKWWWLGGWTPVGMTCCVSCLLLNSYGINMWYFAPFMMGYFVNIRLIPRSTRDAIFVFTLAVVSIMLREYVVGDTKDKLLWDENSYYQFSHLLMVFSILAITQFFSVVFTVGRGFLMLEI